TEYRAESLPEVPRARRTLRKHLIHVPVNPEHHVENSAHEFIRHVVMEEIRHRVDKHHARLGPTRGILEAIGPQPNRERVATVVGRVNDGEAPSVYVREAFFGERFGVTV